MGFITFATVSTPRDGKAIKSEQVRRPAEYQLS